jgi:hypothetical protein
MKTNKIYRITVKLYLKSPVVYYVPAGSLTEMEDIWKKHSPHSDKTPATVEVVAEGVNGFVIPSQYEIPNTQY